ncbi:Zinc finger, RING-type [Cucumis melo var. makuwa]|uniref:Zinc finger, RING-type n=1 Tax=Cucumis melo var. makuwa TaxID=1194695 RepID=A0A5D3C421_CUCMM|nr:Zinc finger, RING-type [Cucumis melo var. makuwa]TYK06070.1 Zinc finger, RING-type [Cucumis melo var. makuwa]
MMEVGFVPSGMSEEETAEAYDINYEISEEVERCGICMDVIVDRGVLDCCQHWFCFVCIDNWATITNLCPLCQKEFQLITCVPVYDTIGSNKVDEESFGRNDDWCFEGKSNVSFPSYYIDENAVICLDGDGCKIRNGSGFTEGESDLDTSIACDSCDTWYHAFCVDFDPDDTSESTWLCPRCGINDQESSINDSVPKFNGDFDPMNTSVAQSFSSKVSVSVADTGETALVVSLIGGNHVKEEQVDYTPSSDELENNKKIEDFMLASEAGRPNVPASTLENTPFLPTSSMENTSVPALGDKELELSLSHDSSISLPHDSLRHVGLKTRCADEIQTESGSLESSRSLTNVSHPINKVSKDEFSMGLHLGLPVGTFLSVDYSNEESGDQSVDVKPQLFPSEKRLLQADDVVAASQTIQEASVIIGIKRKHADCSDHIQKTADNQDDKANSDTKLIKGKNQSVPSKNELEQTKEDDTTKSLAMPLVPTEASLKRISKKKDANVDIMSIVRGRNRRPPPKSQASSNSNGEEDQQENLTGLRVKKIMRRAGEDQESSMLVQKLRNEIREAVRNKCAKEFGENLLDSKLLDAFRAAVSGPKTESQKRMAALAVKAKKSLLQKGKIRESLTKKIYGATNGRRKRAWDRDCEIEFWKHRCIRVRKPEKIATLKSVLDLLRNGSRSPDTKQDSEGQPTNPILSRLYVADTSVFPRNNDIKPLSALKSSSSLEQNKDPLTGISKVSSKAGILPLAGNVGNNCSVSASKSAVGSGKGNHSATSEASVGAKPKLQKSVPSTSSNAIDKRKWALEVLARKTGDGCSVASKKEEDMAVLKGNYPLLAQLPVDMRPELAPSRHNKIPVSVRQAQLYRLTEQFLKKTNLTDMRRTAETELAIADAVNIEKEVADKSNTKVVYLNLCSQEIMHRTDTGRSNTAADLDSSSQENEPIAKSELPADPETDPVVEEALRNAGLLSDSPVNSPPHRTDVNDDDELVEELEPENVMEMDDHPDLDIYGDFEYDLEEENCFTTKAATVMKPPEESESKLKVVLSTLNTESSSHASDAEKPERLKSVELPKDASCLSKNEDLEVGTAPPEIEKEGSIAVPLNSNEVEEPSLAEYEELYGPDTDKQIKYLPGKASAEKPCVPTSESNSQQKDSCNDATSMPIQGGKESDQKCEVKEANLPAGECSPHKKEKYNNANENKPSDGNNSVSKKVETYIKEHVRLLCKSGVITAEQYRWAVQKTTEKVMKYHSKDKNANFLIKEGEKVKKLAEQYVEAAQRKGID